MAQQHTRNTSSVDSTGMSNRPISPHNVSSPTSGAPEHVFLTVPGDRSRGNSVGSDDVSPTQTSFGSETMMGTPAAPGAGAATGTLPSQQGQSVPQEHDVSKITNDPEALTPDPGTEADFEVVDNKFAYSPGMLGKMLNPKSLAAFWKLGGLRGLEVGLRTDRSAGLSVDETVLDGKISWEEVQQQTMMTSQSQSSGSSGDKEKLKTALPAYHETNGNHTSKQVPHAQSTNIFADRRRIFAENRLPEKKVKNIFQLAWIAYNDKILILLTVAAVISFAVGLYQTFGQVHENGEAAVEWVEGLAIMVAILIVVVVGAVNDWQKERQFVKLNKRKEDRTVKVIRSGRLQEISVYDMLVGDVMNLEPGDMVPVDGVLIDGHGIKCDESSATGESDLIKKTPSDEVWRAIEGHRDVRKLDPFILSGSKVTEGVGTFLVTAVGVHSVHGKTMISLREDIEATPLQSKLNRLAEQIAKLGGASALLLFIVLFIKFLVQLRGDRSTASRKGQKFLRIVVTTITIIVVAVPEGLPLAVTLALAFATTRMLKDNNLVRLLRACETMGNATTVCSDKTGTLTQNKMTVVAGSLGTSARFGDRALLSPETADASSKEAASSLDDDGAMGAGPLVKTIDEDVRTTLFQSIVLNSTAFEGEEDGKPTFIGSKTETALLLFARDHLGLQSLSVERANAQIVQLIPFDSARKCMGTVIRLSDGRVRMYVKGASEILLATCSKIIAQPTVAGTEAPMTAETVETLTGLINTYAGRSLRTIGLVYRDFAQWPPQGAATMEDDPTLAVFDDVFRDMVFLGVVGIQDPLRPSVRDSVLQCQKAGVFVRMVTGDNVVTARAIAEECGIFTPGGLVMEGPKFRRLTKMQMDRTIPRLQVLARSSPEDKRTLVKRLKEMGETVAVTGDGTNDAPALKTADVGFSMGIAGTEVAKEASAIILMDDNFSSIVKAIMWGRAVNDAVKKFLQFQLTVNITAVILTFVSAVSNENEQAVLTATQLLWVNLIMDTFAALALATDPPTRKILNRKPDRKSAPLITITMWKMILGQAIYQLAVTFVLYFGGPRIFGYNSAEEQRQLRSLVFNAFVWMQIFNQVNNRRLDNKFNIFEGIQRNRFFMFINVLMVGGQVMIIFVGGAALQVVRLNGAQWGYSILLGALSIPIGVVIRLIPDSFVARILPNIMQRRKTPQVVVTDEEHRYEWNPAIEGIRDELSFLKKIRGGRLNAIKFKLQHRRDTLIPMGRSRSGSRSRSSSVPQTPTDTAAHDFGVNAPPPVHLANTPNSQNRRRTRDRSNSAFAPAAAMAGVVAGSIAGWSPIDRAHSQGEEGGAAGGEASTTAPKLESRGDLEGQEGIVVHPGTDPKDPVITGDTSALNQPLPPSQQSEARPATDPNERRDTSGGDGAGGGVIGKL